MKTYISFPVFCLIFVFLFSACNKKSEFEYNYYTVNGAPAYDKIAPYLNLETAPVSYKVELPKHLTNFGIIPKALDDNLAVLGRVLFWDKNLSKDGKISCGSCHDPNKAFGDDVAFSKGIYDRATTRNSIALGSVLNFSSSYGSDINGSSGLPFFWDNRAKSVSEQAKGTLANPNEMGMSMTDVVNQVEQKEYYLPLFEAAFGKTIVTEEKVLNAITEFINSLGSHSTKFDVAADKQVTNNLLNNYDKNFSDFTASENRGKLIYINSCSNCHGQNFATPMLTKANNGLELDSSKDPGVGGFTKLNSDIGLFKVPTLRNITKSAPYMHDGRFKTLEEVIDHYSTNIKNNPTLSLELKSGNQAKKFNFTTEQKSDLIAFLNTLEDHDLPKIKRFSDPFKN